MSGHSKWSTIKHQKAAADQKRGKQFSRLSRAISIAVAEGKSGDPNFNAHLRLAIEQAKTINMPKENIKRAIEKGLGKESGLALEAITYEGFGPEQIAVIIQCITDNKNRTSAEIKSFFERKGKGLAQSGAVSYLFQRKGKILINFKEGKEKQNRIMELIDLGIEDLTEKKDYIEVFTKPEELSQIKEKISQAGFTIQNAEIIYKPTAPILFENNETAKKIQAFLAELDDFDDIQKIYSNAEFAG